MRAKPIKFLLTLLWLGATLTGVSAHAHGEIEGNTGVFSSSNGDTVVSTSIVKLSGVLHGLVDTEGRNSHCRTSVKLTPEKHLQIIKQSCAKVLDIDHELSRSISRFCKSEISSTKIEYIFENGVIDFTIHQDGLQLSRGSIGADGILSFANDFCKPLTN